MMYGMEKSDSGIVAVKSANKGMRVPAESMERRTEPKGKLEGQSTRRTQDRESVTQAADRIRQFVQREPRERLTTLLHHVTVEALRWAFFALKRNAAAGADGMTWGMYEEGLEGRLADLHDRVHSGAYRATPSRRVNIPKPGWRHTTARRRGHRGQDSPEGCGGDNPDADLRGGVPGVQLWVPARAWGA